jgi:predicted MFS family arabinose efflux permease
VPVAAAGVGSARVRSPLALLAVRDFRVWWLGFVVSALAISAQAFGVGWLVVELAARRGGAGTAALYLGMVGLARAVPTLALGAFGGVAGDRCDRRNLLVVAQAAMGATAVAMGLLIATHAMSVAALLVLSALSATAAVFYHPVRQVIQPRLVGEANLLGAMGLNGSALSVGALVGPLIGGTLVLAIGVGALILACGIASLAVAASLAIIRPQPVERAGPAADSILRSLIEGLSYAGRTPVIRWLLIVFAGVTLLVRPLPFMLPALASDALHAGPRQLSWLVSAAGAGAFLSGLATSWLRASARTTRAAVLVAIAAGLSLVALAVQRSLPAALLLVAATQFLLIQASSLVLVMLQTVAPDGLRGRIVSIQSLLADGGTDCGVFLIGAVGGALGISAALGASGGVLVLLYLGIAIGVPVLMRAPGTAAAPAQRVDAT